MLVLNSFRAGLSNTSVRGQIDYVDSFAINELFLAANPVFNLERDTRAPKLLKSTL